MRGGDGVGFFEVGDVARLLEDAEDGAGDLRLPRLGAGQGGQAVVLAPAEQGARSDAPEAATQEWIVEVRVPRDAGDGRPLAGQLEQGVGTLVARHQGQRRRGTVEDRRHQFRDVHAEEERVDPAVDLDPHRIDERQRREPMRGHGGHLRGDPAPERGADEVDAVEPQLVEQIEIVEGEIGDVLDPLGGRRAAVPRMTRQMDPEALGQALVKGQPATGGARPVEEEERRASPGRDHLDRSPADAHGLAGQVGLSQ